MIKVKTQKSKTGKINIIICRHLEETMSDRVKIFSIPFNYTQFDKIKVAKMKNQKSKNSSARPDHIFREK
jgi:hypothetical protein